MRLILVHGINQQDTNAQALQEMWLDPLRAALERASGWPFDRVTRIDTPFYGARLAELTEAPIRGVAVAQGADDASDEFAEFAGDALAQMALRIGADHARLVENLDDPAIAQGAGLHKKWVKAVARAVETISPLKGALALRVLGQAHAYIKRPHVQAEVDALVRPAFEDDEPAVVVAHSLGTIVTYKLLRKFAAEEKPRRVPFYVTLGSPLGIDVVRQSFAKPRTRPANVARWLNGSDPEDFVALRPALTAENFGTGVENISDIENGYEDPHSIVGYLSDRRIAEAIAAAIEG